MKLAELQNKLITAARENPPSDTVPYAFTKRVMAHIGTHPCSAAAQWAEALWRAAGACLAIVVVFSTISIVTSARDSAPAGDLSQDFEKTMLAGLEADYSR